LRTLGNRHWAASPWQLELSGEQAGAEGVANITPLPGFSEGFEAFVVAVEGLEAPSAALFSVA
jgi:hypothetical protein